MRPLTLFLAAVLVLGVGALVSLVGRQPPAAPAPDTRVILTLGSEDAIWRFIPMDVLPGAAELDLTAPPPP
jgi:hypothetical protein